MIRPRRQICRVASSALGLAVLLTLPACERRVVAARGFGAQNTPTSVDQGDGPIDRALFGERRVEPERRSSMRPVTRPPRPAGSTPANRSRDDSRR